MSPRREVIDGPFADHGDRADESDGRGIGERNERNDERGAPISDHSPLAQRYRRVLRILPASYRRAWEDDMVETFLESMRTGDPDEDDFNADYGAPSGSEVASVVALALRLRLGGADASPRSVARGEVVRLAVLMGLLIQATVAIAGLVSTLWIAGRLPWLPPSPVEWSAARLDVWRQVGEIAGLAWVLAYLAALLGHRRAAQLFALVATVPLMITVVRLAVESLTLGTRPYVFAVGSELLLVVLLVVSLMAFRDDTPPVQTRAWLVVLALAVVATVLLTDFFPLDLAGLYCAGVAAAGVGYLIGSTAGWIRRTPAWSGALALLALIVLGFRIVSVLDYVLALPFGGLVRPMVSAVVEAVMLCSVAVPLVVLAVRGRPPGARSTLPAPEWDSPP